MADDSRGNHLPVQRRTAASDQDRFDGSMGRRYEHEVPSTIDRLQWSGGRTIAEGGTTALKIATDGVGDGAPVEIAFVDLLGKPLKDFGGPIEKKIHGNSLEVEVTAPPGFVPDGRLSRDVTAKVTLPKHRQQDGKVPEKKTILSLEVVPKVAIRNLRWSKTKMPVDEVVEMEAEVVGLRLDAVSRDALAFDVYRYDPRGAHTKVGTLKESSVAHGDETVVVENEQTGKMRNAGPDGQGVRKVKGLWCPEPAASAPASVRAHRLDFRFKRFRLNRAAIVPAWELEDGESGRSYEPPRYFFRLRVAGLEADSQKTGAALLELRDTVEIWHFEKNVAYEGRLGRARGSEVRNNDERPAAGRTYEIELADGTRRRGRLDGAGRAVIADVPPGPVRYRFSREEGGTSGGSASGAFGGGGATGGSPAGSGGATEVNAESASNKEHLARRNFQRALEGYEAAITAHPDSLSLYSNHAYLLALMGKKSQALAELDSLLEARPADTLTIRIIQDALTRSDRDDLIRELTGTSIGRPLKQ